MDSIVDSLFPAAGTRENSPKIRENRKTCNKEETEEERKEESEKEREREEARSKGRFQNVEEGSTTYYLVA